MRKRQHPGNDPLLLVRRQLLGEAVTSAPYLVIVADETMRIAAASDAVSELLGWSPEEITGLSVHEILVDRSEGERRYNEFLAAGAQRGTIALRRKDGSFVDAFYEAHETQMASLTYYVSILFLAP